MDLVKQIKNLFTFGWFSKKRPSKITKKFKVYNDYVDLTFSMKDGMSFVHRKIPEHLYQLHIPTGPWVFIYDQISTYYPVSDIIKIKVNRYKEETEMVIEEYK